MCVDFVNGKILKSLERGITNYQKVLSFMNEYFIFFLQGNGMELKLIHETQILS